MATPHPPATSAAGPTGDSSVGAVNVRPARPDDHDAIRDILAVGYGDFDPDTPYLAYVLDPAAWIPESTATLVAVDRAVDRVLGVVAFAVAGTPLHEPVVPPMGDASFRFLAVDPASGPASGPESRATSTPTSTATSDATTESSSDAPTDDATDHPSTSTTI